MQARFYSIMTTSIADSFCWLGLFAIWTTKKYEIRSFPHSSFTSLW